MADIGKYRKHGLNPQDQAWVSPGDGGFPVFDTELGRLTMLICYDDTYWQYPRLAALHKVDVVAWLSSSDRVSPGTPPAQAKGDHSTVATVQHIAAFNGVWLVAATRDGIERNPLTGQTISTTTAVRASGIRPATRWPKPRLCLPRSWRRVRTA